VVVGSSLVAEYLKVRRRAGAANRFAVPATEPAFD